MTELKCPFCQQELRKIHPTYIICDTCRITGEDKLWQALIDTKKKLDIAVDALKELKPQKAKGGGYWAVKSTDAIKLINTALEQIKYITKGE